MKAKYDPHTDANIIHRHKARRMFVILNHEIKIAPSNDKRSHYQWFLDEGWLKNKEDTTFEVLTRGILSDKGLCFYSGKKFLVTEKDEEEFFKYLKELTTLLPIDLNTPVSGGKIVSDINEEWPPRKKYGIVEENL